ncbi:hypothetical protein ACVDG8_009310 [Mesorhizobium sp. ORM8.1]
MNFEWDESKAKRNKLKHGVSFDVASEFDFDGAMVFEDATGITAKNGLSASASSATKYTSSFTRCATAMSG